MMEDTTPLPVSPTLLIREAQFTDHPKLIHYPIREWVLQDGEEVVICRPLCGSEEESPMRRIGIVLLPARSVFLLHDECAMGRL